MAFKVRTGQIKFKNKNSDNPEFENVINIFTDQGAMKITNQYFNDLDDKKQQIIEEIDPYIVLAEAYADKAEQFASEAMRNTDEGYVNLVASIAPEYSALNTYITGSYVLKNSSLYRCIQAINMGEGWTSEHWKQVTIGEEITNFYNLMLSLYETIVNNIANTLNIMPELHDSSIDDADLDITDENGNVLVRFSDGHIQTKNFCSGTIESNYKMIYEAADQNADLDITDDNGNILVRMSNGHIETKNFDSSKIPKNLNDINGLADLDISDEMGNVLVSMKDGHIETKNFDSSKIGTNTDLTTTAKETLVAAINELDDIVKDIPDVNNINIITKNFGDANVDTAIADEYGHILLQCSKGHIQTKNFDSMKVQFMLPSTNDTTDRAAEINTMLATTGECKLGPGDFYVSGIVMSGYSTLSGAGSKTRIILLDSVTNGAAVKMKSYCTVKDVMIGTDDSYTPSSVPTTRYGIIRENDGGSHYIFGKISNVSIEGISQALVLKDITTADRTGLLVENVNIYKCDIGINIKKCQYSRFNNIIIASCYSGVLNNAGNNLFMNCTFISCTQAFLMTDATVTNTGHGSVVGCQFNHCGTGDGIAIKANKMVSGFVFSGCQLFASRVEIQNSIGIAFHGCNFGGTNGVNGYQINVINSDGTNRVLMIDNCIFANNLVLSTTNTSGTTTVIVNNCYKQNGTLITIGN